MKRCLRLLTRRAVTPFFAASDARRTMPGPQSIRKGVSPTMTAVAGPERSGFAFGVPVPRVTTIVAGVFKLDFMADSCANAVSLDMSRIPNKSVVIRSAMGLVAPCLIVARSSLRGSDRDYGRVGCAMQSTGYPVVVLSDGLVKIRVLRVKRFERP